MGRPDMADTLNLYALKAMAIGLRDGRRAETGYLEKTAAGASSQLRRMAERMMKALAEMPEGEEQRRKAVHSMACMAPLKDPSRKGEQARGGGVL